MYAVCNHAPGPWELEPPILGVQRRFRVKCQLLLFLGLTQKTYPDILLLLGVTENTYLDVLLFLILTEITYPNEFDMCNHSHV
jgi:hypothetical protein